MKIKIITVMVVAIMALIISSGAADKFVTIVNVGSLDTRLLESIRSHVEHELAVDVKVREMAPLKGGDLKEIGKKIAITKTTNEVCLIAFVTFPSNTAIHAAVMTNEQVAVINTLALSSVDTQKYVRRLQRWGIRGVAFLLGTGSDIDPHSVMFDYMTLDDLDNIGMNLSPPWANKYINAAKVRGLKVGPLYQRQKFGPIKTLPVTVPATKNN